MCGGPTSQQKQAATTNLGVGTEAAANYTAGLGTTTPFYTNLVKNPQQDPALAQQYGQQLAQMKARNAGYGDALPSGFAEQEKTDLGENYAKTQDANMFSRQMAGAQGLNPNASAQVATGSDQTVLQAPLQNNFWTNLIGGILGSGAGFKSGSTAFAV